MKYHFVLTALGVALIAGCVSSTATRTVQSTSGDTTTDSVKVSAFLASLHNGAYSNGSGMTLTVTDATPDQQSIAILAGGVVEMGKMFMTAKGTNTASAITNSAAKP